MERLRLVSFAGALALAALIIPVAASAVWQPDGNKVTGQQLKIGMVPDGYGGAIVFWLQDTEYTRDPYAQRIDDRGNLLWPGGGICLYSSQNSKSWFQVASDGLGGAYLTWMEQRGGNDNHIYAQHVTNYGHKWNADGVPVCTAPGWQVYPRITGDGSNGAFITWIDSRGGAYGSIYAQRIDYGGNLLWAENGVPATAALVLDDLGPLTADGFGGFITTWWDFRSGNDDVYAQRVNSNGAMLWGSTGVPVATRPDTTEFPAVVVPDNAGGAIIGYRMDAAGQYRSLVQRIDGNGNALWPSAGIPVCSAAGTQGSPAIVPWGAAGAILAWTDNRRGGDYDVYAQRIDGNGNYLWDPDGIPICTTPGIQSGPAVIKADANSVLLVWADPRNSGDIYAQKSDSSGSVLWAPDGVPVCSAPLRQYNSQAVSDGSGGGLAAWIDLRDPSGIYAQRILSNGHTANEVPPTIASVLDVPSDQGGWVNLQWSRSSIDCLPDTVITHYSIWRRMPATAASPSMAAAEPGAPLNVPLDFKGKCLRVAYDFAWEWLENVPAHHFELYSQTTPTQYDSLSGNPGWHYYMVSAHTSNPLVYYDSAVDSGYSVDNLSPTPPTSLEGVVTHDPVGLMLTWDPNEESDRGRYRVYRGLSEEFVPAPDNLIGESDIPSFFDEDWSASGSCYYKVSATDVHGNESGYALLRPEDVTGVETPALPAASYLAQNFPNPFNPTTKISFGLSAPGPVSLRIYDATGRLVRVLVEGVRPAGHYAETWDGRDSRGAAVASGVYFCRLDAGAFTETRKMALLR